jgi:holliday junction resolvase YEN1
MPSLTQPLSPNMKTDGDMVAIYTAKSISEHPDVSLMEGGMILFALLAGGDYDQVSAVPRHSSLPLMM